MRFSKFSPDFPHSAVTGIISFSIILRGSLLVHRKGAGMHHRHCSPQHVLLDIEVSVGVKALHGYE